MGITSYSTNSTQMDTPLKELTRLLNGLGYEWDLECIDIAKNHFDIRLKKQGSSFLVGSASSGERELLTYLFAIYTLNVRDALIIIDEPEMHLHPKWQKLLFSLFVQLSKGTGNQFLLATHAPTFVSPASIQYISRVFIERQRSRIVRLDQAQLPESKHLLNIVNSQNNERMFFADKVILVEGLSDRIFFEAVLQRHAPSETVEIVEVISVGGKGLFSAYVKLLRAGQISCSIIADLDYLEEIGSGDIKNLFTIDYKEIKKDVIDNVKSLDGAAFAARIDQALANGDWSDVQDLWAYIKARRRRLKDNLTATEEEKKAEFISEKRSEGIFVLSMGCLEDYLPIGYRAKDLEKLIGLVSSPRFWDDLPEEGKAELTQIANQILKLDEERCYSTNEDG